MIPACPSDPSQQEVGLRLGVMALTDEGPRDAPVLLMVHGYPGSGRDFRWLSASLNMGVRVIRPDLPGMGATPLCTGPGPGLHERAEAVIELIEAMDLRELVLLGHSMGGGIASEVASRLADRVRGLVLLAPIGCRPHRAFRISRPALTQRVLDIPFLGQVTRPLVRGLFRSWGFSRSLPDAQLFHAIDCAAGLDFEEVDAAHRGVGCPTLMAWAGDDQLIEASIFKELSEIVPEGPRLDFVEGGHNIQKSMAVEIAEKIVFWMGDSCDLFVRPFRRV